MKLEPAKTQSMNRTGGFGSSKSKFKPYNTMDQKAWVSTRETVNKT